DASAPEARAPDSDAIADVGRPRQETCGNGRVDADERCDIAIAPHQAGACPESCSGRGGCFKPWLTGQRCGVRCEEIEIKEAIDGDGCCPAGASAATDDDCSPSCGNGVIELGESCDPAESCPQPDACTSSDACIAARYSGSPALCSARCELRPRTAC